jgi:hypothetical protein
MGTNLVEEPKDGKKNAQMPNDKTLPFSARSAPLTAPEGGKN